MGAKLWTTGPAHIYVGKTAGGGGSGFSPSAPLGYLGTAKRSPIIEIEPTYRPVFADIAGHDKPIDKMIGGEDALVRADLTRFDEAVYKGVAGIGGGTRGKVAADTIGKLVVLQKLALSVAVTFPYATGDMPKGYRFAAAVLAGHRLFELGTMGRVLGLVFYCFQAYQSTDGSFLLYDHSVDGMTAPS